MSSLRGPARRRHCSEGAARGTPPFEQQRVPRKLEGRQRRSRLKVRWARPRKQALACIIPGAKIGQASAAPIIRWRRQRGVAGTHNPEKRGAGGTPPCAREIAPNGAQLLPQWRGSRARPPARPPGAASYRAGRKRDQVDEPQRAGRRPHASTRVVPCETPIVDIEPKFKL